MTKEEAITNLNMISIAFVEPITKEQRKLIDDTFNMAIKALSQEPICDRDCEHCTWTECPIEPCDDTVSIRKDVLKCRVGNIVAYNVEWFKKHWRMEMDIVYGVRLCDDAVSREAVLGLAYDMSEIDGEHFTEPCMVVDVEDIQKLPSVTQKSETVTEFADRCRECGKMRKGHWISGINWKCNNCGFVDSGAHGFNFCPDCGAKMESEDKE